jgi:hypothetical protein
MRENREMADDDVLGPREAADLLRRSADHARARLMVNQPLIYGAWGLAWLIGDGSMWLTVHGQHPFRGAAGWAAAVLAAGIALAIVSTGVATGRAVSGIGGVSARQGIMFGLAWPAGFAAFFVIVGATGHLGASGSVMGVLGAAGPLLLTGLIYVVGAGIWVDRVMFWLGLWELAVGAGAAWAGPAGVLLVAALAGGGGFLAAAALVAWRNRA